MGHRPGGHVVNGKAGTGKGFEYLDDLAAELEVQRSGVERVVERLGIDTQTISVPPSDVELAVAVSKQDAERIRAYYYDTGEQ
jgi:hypothetical protein